VLEELEAELRDRFGPMPPAASQFLSVLSVKAVLSRLQVQKADLSVAKAVLTFGSQASAVGPEALVAWMAGGKRQAKLLPPSKLELRYPEGLDVRAGLEYLRTELELLLDSGANTPQKAGA